MQRQASEPEDRGVYRSWWRRGGVHVIYAVDSRGDVLQSMIALKPGIDEAAAFEKMQRLLDYLDPLPTLRLVKDGPTPAKPVKRLPSREEIELIADPIQRMVLQRKRWAAEGRLPRLPRLSG